MQRYARDVARWINPEKTVFLAAAAWLAVTGVGYQRAPVTAGWGPARVADSPPDHGPLKLEAPPPIGEFLAGERDSPFTDQKRLVTLRPGQLPDYERWKPPEAPKQPRERKKPPPPPPPGKKPPAEATSPAERPKGYEFPLIYTGYFRVGDGDLRTVFIAKEDGKYFSVREGEEIPGLGVRVISATKNVVIVENDEGRRFRLDDLLRSTAQGQP